jgi:hypothetical protein
MAKELMEIGGFITEGAEIVNHDNTLSGNGTVDSPLGVVPGYNETVLWENTASALTKDITWPQTLSETVNNFEKVKFYYGADSTIIKTHAYEFYAVDKTSYSLVDFRVNDSNNNVMFRNGWFNLDGSSLNNTFNLTINLNTGFSTTNANNQGWNYLYKIVGINRIANN